MYIGASSGAAGCRPISRNGDPATALHPPAHDVMRTDEVDLERVAEGLEAHGAVEAGRADARVTPQVSAAVAAGVVEAGLQQRAPVAGSADVRQRRHAAEPERAR